MEHVVDSLAEHGIHALMQVPEADAPIILLAHGINSDHTEDRSENKPGFFDLLVEHLAERGVGSMRFDFRGHGRSTQPDGYVSIRSETDDLRTIVSWATRSGVHLRGIVACSFAACATGLLLEEGEAGFDTVVLVNPVLRPFETFLDPGTPWAQASFTTDTLRRLEDTGVLMLDGEFPLGKAFVDDVRSVKPEKGLSTHSGPLALVHGTADTYVPFEYSADLSHRLRASMLAVDGAEHGFGVLRDRKFVSGHVADYVLWAMR